MRYICRESVTTTPLLWLATGSILDAAAANRSVVAEVVALRVLPILATPFPCRCLTMLLPSLLSPIDIF